MYLKACTCNIDGTFVNKCQGDLIFAGQYEKISELVEEWSKLEMCFSLCVKIRLALKVTTAARSVFQLSDYMWQHLCPDFS